VLGDHFEVDRAVAEPDYAAGPAELLERHGLGAGRSARTSWPGGVRSDRRAPQGRPAARGLGRRRARGRAHARRGADEGHRARGRAPSACRSSPASPARPIWHQLYSFPPNDWAQVQRGYEDFAERWGPIIDVFDAEGVRFALEVHPTEIAYDFVTTRKALAAIDRREGFGINLDPSHFIPQFLDPAAFASEFADRIYHVHVKDSQVMLDGRRSILGSHIDFGEAERGWTFVSPGHGDVDFEALFRVPEPHRLRRAAVGRVGGLRAWTASGARPTRSASCARPTSRPRRWPSTRLPGVGMSAFHTQGDARGAGDVPSIGVGMLGYAFMGKAHANAYRTLSYMTWPPPLMPDLVADRRAQRGGRWPRPRGATASPAT
jgi:hypothetical protein